MWAPNLDDQFRVLKGGVSPATIPGGTAGYSPFVEPTTGASTQLDSVDVTKPGIADSWLRTVVVNWAGSKDSGLTSAQTAAVIEFATRGALPTPAAKTLVCEALKKLMAPETINRLGISSIDVQAVVAQVASMTLNADPLNAAADDFRKKSMAENGYTPTEVKFRNRMGLISPKNSNVQTILQEMTREGTLKKGMSESDIATAVTTYVQTHFNYISDGVTVEGKSADHWNTINETMAAKGGDCEDLSILTASLLMGALSKSGVSDEAIHRKVTLAAGYLVDKTGAAKGHATVKFVLEDGKSLALDATSNKPPVAFDSLGMVLVLEGNDTTFKQYKAIDEFFETALGLNAFDTHGTIEKINHKLLELKELLAHPVEVPLASADGKSFTLNGVDITQSVDWKNNSIDFGFYTLSKTQISDFGGTWHSDMYVTKINEATFYDFMSQSRDLINRAVMMFNVVNMVLEFDEHQANEIGVSGFEDYEKSELLETMDSAAKYKNRFVNAMNGSLGKISSSIETVVNEMFLFIGGTNGAQEARINAELQEYGRGNIGIGILSGIADEISGAFSFVRTTAALNLSAEMSKINLANAEAYVRYTMKFGAGISLWDTSALTPEASEMIGDSEQKKTDIRLTLQRGLDQLTSMEGKFDDLSGDFGASLGVGQLDSNKGTIAGNNLNLLGKSGDQNQYVEFGMNYILRLRDSMVDYQNFLRSTYMITEAQKSAKRQVAEQISSTSGLQDGAKGTSSTTQTKGVVVNAMSTELQRQTSGLSQIDLMTRPFVDTANGYINARYGYARWYKDLADKAKTIADIAIQVAAGIASVTASIAAKAGTAIIFMPVIPIDPAGWVLYSEMVGDYVANAVPDALSSVINFAAQAIFYDLELNTIKEKNTNLMVQEGSGYGASANTTGLNSSKNTATQNASSVNPYDTSTGNYYSSKMESFLYDARTQYDGATGDVTPDVGGVGGDGKFTLNDGKSGETNMQTTRFMHNRGDGKVFLRGDAMASHQIATSMDYMKVSIYLSVMKALQDAMEGVTATMFGRSKTSTVSSFDGQIDAIVGKESSIVDAYRYENQSRVATINSQYNKSKNIYNQEVQFARAGAKMGLQLARVFGEMFFAFAPIPFVASVNFGVYVGIETGVVVAEGIEAAAVLTNSAIGNYGYQHIMEKDYDPYAGSAVNQEFVNRLNLQANVNPVEKWKKYTSADNPSVGDRYSRLDDKEAYQLFSIKDPDTLLTASNSLAGIGGDFKQINFEKLLNAYKEMTQINQVRTFMTMIDQAMYNAKQNTLRAMFGGNATGNHQALSVMASAIDRYVGSVMGTFSGQTGVFQDFITEASGWMEAINERTTQRLNAAIEGSVTAAALALKLIAPGFRANTKALTTAATGGMSTQTYLRNFRKMVNGSTMAGAVASVAKIALGVTMMKSVIANKPQITSQLMNYDDTNPDNEPLPTDSEEVKNQKQNAKLRGTPTESSQKNNGSNGPVKNYGMSDSIDTSGAKQRVNTSDKARAERMVSRQSRSIQVLRDISLALSDAKGDAAEDMGGGPSAKNAYRSMNSILNQQTNLEQQSVGLIFQALTAQVEAHNRGVDFVVAGVSGALTAAVVAAAASLPARNKPKEANPKTKVKETTATDIDTAAPTAAPTATPKPAAPKPAAPANKIPSVDSSSIAKTSNPNKKFFTPDQLHELEKIMNDLSPILALMISDVLTRALSGGGDSQMYSEDKAKFGLKEGDYFKDGGDIQQEGGEPSGATGKRAETKGSVGFMDTSQLETAMFANALLSSGYDVRAAQFQNLGHLYDNVGKAYANKLKQLFQSQLKSSLVGNPQESENKALDSIVAENGPEGLRTKVLNMFETPEGGQHKMKADFRGVGSKEDLALVRAAITQLAQLTGESSTAAKKYNEENKEEITAGRMSKMEATPVTKEQIAKAVVDQLRAGALAREKAADVRSAGTGSVGQMGAQRAGLMGIIPLRDALEKMESAGAAPELTKDLKVLLGTATGSTAGIKSAATALGADDNVVSAALKNMAVGSSAQPELKPLTAIWSGVKSLGSAILAVPAGIVSAVTAIVGVFTKAGAAYTAASAAAPPAAPVAAGPFAAGISEMARGVRGVWAALFSVGTDLAKGSWDAVRYGVPALGSAVMAGGRAVFSAGAYVVGAVRNRASASTAIMKDGKYTDYFMGLDVDQRTKLLESEFKKAGGGSALSQGLTDLAANMAASADRKGFQAKSDALLAKVGKSMEANLVSQPGGVGDDNRNKILAMSHLEQALIGMASYNLSLEVSARLAGTTLDQSGLSRADLKLAQAVLDANGLGNSPSGGYRFLRGAVAVVSLNMLEVDPKGAGLRWGSGPVSAATSAIGSARSGLYRLAGNFFGRGSEFKYEVASEVGTRALDKTKLDAFREGLNQNAVEAALTTAFDGNGVKAKQVMEVLTGKATQVAVDKLKDSVSREKFDIKQQERRVLFLAFGNEGSEILKGLEYIEDVGLKARQESIEKYAVALKENALEVHDLVSGAGTQRDDAYAAEGRGFDRRTAAVAFADIKDAALGTSRFETRGTEFAKKFEEAKDKASKNSNDPGGYLITQMYDIERVFRAELTHLIVTHDDKRAGEMIKGALGSGKEGRELVSRVMQGLAVQDMAYGSAMFKRVMETTIARYSRNDEVMRGLGEAVATAVEKAGAGSRIAGLTMETPGLALRAYRSVHDVLLGDSARGVTAKQVGDSFAASVGDSDISRAVMGRGWWGKVIDAGLGHAPVTDSEPVVDSSNIKQVETRMANAVAGQLSEIKGFGTLASHMGDDDMARMVKALDPDKKDKLIKFVEAGSGVTELDKAGRILDKAAAEYTKSLKSVGAKQKLNDALVNYAEFAVTEFSQMISREMADGRSDGSGKSLALGLEVMEKAAARVHFVEKSMGDPTHSISESISNVAKKVAAVPLPQVPITEETRLAYVGQLETALGGTLATAREQEGATMNPLLVDAVLLPANSKMESMFLLGINAAKSRGDHNKPLAALSGETMLALSKLKASDNKAEVLAFMERLKIAVDFDAEPAEGQSRDDWMSLKKEQYEDYSKNTKPGTYSDFSDLNRSNGEVPTIELKKRANGVLQKVLELSATGDFGSINQLLGNIGRTGGASGNLLIEMVGVELRRLGKQQQLEQYLKQSNTNSEEMIKTVSLDKKFQQDAKARFGEALRGNTIPVSLEEYHLMDSDRLAGMKEDLDRSEALVSLANELGGSPAKLKAVMSDPSAVGLLGKLLAQGAAMYLPGAKRLIDTLLKMEDTSAYGLQELGEAVADAGLRIDYVRGDATVSVREEIEKLVTEVKDAQIKLESKPEVKGPIAEKAEGFVTAIKLGYQGRPLAPLSEKARVTQAKIMLLGGPAAVDKARSDFQNFARVDPTGAAILIKDLDTVTPNHANTLLTGFNTKNLSPSDAVGLATALAAAAEATGDKALTPETLGAVNTAKKEVDAFIAANPKTRQITQNVMAGSDFKAEVSALATDLAGKLHDGDLMKGLATKMKDTGTLSSEELQSFNDNIERGVDPEFRPAARELAHLVLADTNPPLFLVTHTINAGRNGASTMLASDAVREKLKTALADSDIPSETRMDCAATLARGAILGGAPIKDMAETLANLVTNSQANPTARSELLKPGSASATAIRSHIEGKPEFAVLREEMNPAGEKFQAMTEPQKLAFMGVPGSANSLATESPGTYVSFLMSPAADGVANVDKDRLRALFSGSPAELGQRIAAASPRTLVLAEAATGCIKLSMRAAIATGNDADADVFIAGCKTAATGIAADFTTPGATGLEGLQEMALQTLDSLKSAGQVVARRTEYTGGVLIDLARKIETNQKTGRSYTAELNIFCATVSGQDPALGQILPAAIQGGADFTRLTQLMAAITPDAVVLPKKEAILWILSRGLMDGVAKGQT